jgi:hypothetical protein
MVQPLPVVPPPRNARREVPLECGEMAWVDTSGHLVNAAGDRIDDQGRVTKARGAPGRGYVRRQQEAAEQEAA